MAGVLSTANLRLRVPILADVDVIHRACQDADIARYTFIPVPYTRDDALDFVTDASASAATGYPHPWVIETRRDGTFVGVAGVGTDGGLGYWCAASMRRHGHLTEAVRAVITDALDPEGRALGEVRWRAVVGNVASARLAARLGFVYTGRDTEHRPGPDVTEVDPEDPRLRDEVDTAVLHPADLGHPGRGWPPEVLGDRPRPSALT